MRLALPLLATLAVALAACSSATPTPDIPAEVLIERMREAMDQVESYRFTGEIVSQEEDSTSLRANASGEWSAPEDSYQRLAAANDPSSGAMELLVVGGRLFERGSSRGEIGEWRERSSVRGLRSGLGVLLPDRFATVEVTPEQFVTDVPAHRLVASPGVECPITEVGPGMGAYPDLQQSYTLFISRADYRLVRLEVRAGECPALPTETRDGIEYTVASVVTVTATYDFYDFNEPISIELPEGFR